MAQACQGPLAESNKIFELGKEVVQTWAELEVADASLNFLVLWVIKVSIDNLQAGRTASFSDTARERKGCLKRLTRCEEG